MMAKMLNVAAATQSMPPLTQAIEHLVHVQGMEPDHVACQLRMRVTEVRAHLDVARSARHSAAMGGTDSQDDGRVPGPSTAQRIADRNAEILRMHEEGIPASEIADTFELAHASVCNILAEHRRLAAKAE